MSESSHRQAVFLVLCFFSPVLYGFCFSKTFLCFGLWIFGLIVLFWTLEYNFCDIFSVLKRIIARVVSGVITVTRDLSSASEVVTTVACPSCQCSVLYCVLLHDGIECG